MKNALHYYYGLTTQTIHQMNKRYSFQIDKFRYVLMPAERDLEELKQIYQLTQILRERGLYCHEIVLNTSGQILTYINQVSYILLKLSVKEDDVVILSDLILFQNKTKNIGDYPILKRDDWYQLWTNKIDYFEYQVSQLSKKHPRIRESFSYFVGLAETSISLFHMLGKKDTHILSVSHKRIQSGDTLFDLYNPLNFVLDIPSRDASEYFKSSFFNQPDIINEIIYYLTYSNLSEYECQMFFIRLLFPTFYFDIYEEVILDEKNEKELLKVVTHTKDYENMIVLTYQYLKSIIYLPEIEWLNKLAVNY